MGVRHVRKRDVYLQRERKFGETVSIYEAMPYLKLGL